MFFLPIELINAESNFRKKNNFEDINQIQILPPTYLLGPGDVISIKLYKFEDFTSTVTILPDGTINLPRINPLYIDKLSLNEANDLITKRYKKIIKTPIVYVDLIKARPLRINVVGEVQRPGFYSMNSKQQNQISNSDGGESLNIKSFGWPSVIEAIQIAGGLTTEADFRKVKLKRFNKANNKIEIINIDFWEPLSNGSLNSNYPIFDGDIVYVSRALTSTMDEKFVISKSNLAPSTITVSVIGEVVNPGKTNIRSNSPIRQSILNAGGYTAGANRSKITLLRLKNNGMIEKKVLKAKDFDSLNNIYLEDRDVVIVDKNKLAKTSKSLKSFVEPLNPVISAATMYELLFGD